MKKILFIMLCFVFAASLVFAQDDAQVSKTLDSAQGKGEAGESEYAGLIDPSVLYNFEMGLEYTNFAYKEPSIDVEETTDFYGIFGALSGHSTANKLMARLEGRFAAGPVDYDGKLNDGTAWTDKGDDFIFEGRGLIGRDFTMNNATITPLIGIGWRYLNDQLDSQYAYEREISYLYSPVGFEASVPFQDTWKMVLRAEYDIFWQGWVKSHLSQVNSAFNDLDNKQDGGYGARASIAIQKQLKNSIVLSVEPFFRFWDIDQSNNANVTFAGTIVGYGYEPANRTKEFGVRLSLIW